MAMLLVRILGVDDKMSATTKQYTDYAEIAGYAREAVYVLSEMNVFMVMTTALSSRSRLSAARKSWRCLTGF